MDSTAHTKNGKAESRLNADMILDHINGKDGNEKKPDFPFLLDAARVTPTEEIKENPVCLSFIQKGYACTIGSLGNFIAIIGKAKSRKTYFVLMLIAAALKGILFGLLKMHLPKGKTGIMVFDTEMSRFHVQRSVRTICTLSEQCNPANLYVYGLRKYSPQERLELIEYAIYNTEGIGLVVIDGIKDLVSSINDEDTATMITSKLLKWTEEREIHLITVLHQNKGDNNARGHLGTEVINKAETVISITKEQENPNVSTVKPEFCRDKDFEPFAFEIDNYGLPYISEEVILTPGVDAQKRRGGREKLTEADIPEETHIKILKEIFSFQAEQKYGELQSQLQVYFNKHGVKIGENKAANFITHYKNEEYLIATGKSPKTIYTLSTTLPL